MEKKLRLVFIFFFISVVSLLLLFLLYTHQFKTLIDSNEGVRKTKSVINQIQKIQSALVGLENIERDFLLRRRDTLPTFNIIKQKAAEINNSVRTLKILTESSTTQQQTLIKLKDDISKRLMVLEKSIVTALQDNALLVNVYNNNEKAIMVDFNQLIFKMENEEFNQLQRLEESKKHSESIAPSYVELIISLTIIVLIISFGLMVLEIRKSKKYERELEIQLVELNANKSELEEIAFVASHHLMEPIIKIRTFHDRLALMQSEVSGEGLVNIKRIDKLALRIQELIDDLVQYTMITQVNEPAVKVDLNLCVNQAIKHLSSEIGKCGAIITMQTLPDIYGHPDQLEVLFTHLIENALKYSSKERTPHITIHCEKAGHRPIIKGNKNEIFTNYIKVSVSDNGLGFDNTFAEKIFLIFQRLHHQDSPFSGKGIGLAICRRIMVNHVGKIEAIGVKDKGATFHLFFPV